MKNEVTSDLTDEIVITKIMHIRDQKVMMDRDLAVLYGIETKVLKQAVKRNINRFPLDFMFELTENEENILRSQNVTSNRGGNRYAPMVFTEHGVLMLSSVLKSDRAVEMNIQIVRVFSKMKELLFNQKDILIKLQQIESMVNMHDQDIGILSDYVKALVNESQDADNQAKRKKIGFNIDES